METTIKVLAQDNDLNYDVVVTCIRSNENRNRWDYQNIAEFAETFVGTPILCAYVGEQIADGHNMKEVTAPDGKVSYDFRGSTAERIVGAISDNPDDIEIRTDAEGEWVIARGKLWRFYNSQLVDHIAEVGMMEVSAETEVFESHMEGDVEVFTKWRALGVTILNEKVAPAIPGANIKALQEMESEFKELKLKVAAYKSNESQKEDKEDAAPAKETVNKPHIREKNNAKESDKMTKFNKKQLAELASKFEGYKVLAAGSDESGIHVCLMSEDGAAAIYTMDSLEDTVAPEKIVKVNAQITFGGSDWAIDVDAFEVVDNWAAENVRANSALESAQSELREANDRIASMVANEMNRRVSAAKAAATATLAKFNANRTDPAADIILDPIMASIDNGEFSSLENENGEWIGEDAVRTRVLAACADDVIQKDAAYADSHRTQFVWEGLRNEGSFDRGDVASLLNQLGI